MPQIRNSADPPTYSLTSASKNTLYEEFKLAVKLRVGGLENLFENQKTTS